MSGWGMGWFGGGGTQRKKDAPKKAILDLRSTMEMLGKREKHLQVQIDEQDQQARKFVNTNKTQAKAALRRKKNLEATLEQTQSSMFTLEREIATIETANINKETFEAMRQAKEAMSTINNGMTLDSVDRTMEDLADQHAISREIGTALTAGVHEDNAADEEDLENELEDLQQQELDNKVLDAGTMPVNDKVQALPAAGNRPLPNKAKAQEEYDEDAELEQLKAAMAIAE